MKIEILSKTDDTRYGSERPTHVKITCENGEVVEISVEDDSCSNHQYSPYLEIYQKQD